jgi:hypothetical protein
MASDMTAKSRLALAKGVHYFAGSKADATLRAATFVSV